MTSNTGIKSITYPRLGENVTRRCRIGLDFLPQLSDEDSQILGLLRIVSTPDCGQQLPMSQHLARVSDQMREQLEFLRRQVNLFSKHDYFSCLHIQLEVASFQHRRIDILSRRSRRSSQSGSHPRQKFFHAEW